eukprot:73955_1
MTHAHRRRARINIIILGAANVGKTSISAQYIHHKYSKQYKPTIGADFDRKMLQSDNIHNNRIIEACIWDTAGQERFQSLGSAFYRGADAVVFVYDITNKQTFADVDFWRESFIQAWSALVADVDFWWLSCRRWHDIVWNTFYCSNIHSFVPSLLWHDSSMHAIHLFHAKFGNAF